MCVGWQASRQNYKEILERASWYIKKAYVNCRISYSELFEWVEKDMRGMAVPVNLYDAIEEIYGLNAINLAKFLNVSVGTINYARSRRTPQSKIPFFSEKLCIPQRFFVEMTSDDLGLLDKCKRKFFENNRRSLSGIKLSLDKENDKINILDRQTNKTVGN